MDNIGTKIRSIIERLDEAYAPNTLKAYYADAGSFVDWCSERNIEPFPLHSDTLCMYIKSLQVILLTVQYGDGFRHSEE